MNSIEKSEVEFFKKKLKEDEVEKDQAISAWKEAEEARSAAVRERDEARSEKDEALVSANSFWTMLAEEQTYAEKRVKSSKVEGRVEAVKRFFSDQQKLAAPTFMLGFTKAVDEVVPLLSKEQKSNFLEHENYNPMASWLVDMTAEGIQQDRNLDEVMAKFNVELELSALIDELFSGSPGESSHTEEPT